MITIRQSIESFVIILLGTALALFITLQRNNTSGRSLYSSAAIPVATTPAPTEAPVGPVTTTMDSPEGSKTLALEKLDTTYTVYTALLPDGEAKEIASQKVLVGSSLEIPFNTWSPNALYFFLIEKTSGQTNYLVYHNEGTAFSNDATSLSIQEFFKEKVPNYSIEDVTGWADNMLLIVNAKSTESEDRVSFWFDVTSQSFIRLSTYFK